MLQSEKWHTILLQTSLDNKLIKPKDFLSVKELLRFRHLFFHRYGKELKEEEIVHLAKRTQDIYNKFITYFEKRLEKLISMN